jgi:hypothetical protein
MSADGTDADFIDSPWFLSEEAMRKLSDCFKTGVFLSGILALLESEC